MAFWTDATLRDPKRNYRFTVQLLAFPEAATWYAKSVTKPKFAISETPHMYLNHTFYYPGKVTWETVNVTLVDPVEPDAVANTMAIIQNAGYHPPRDASDLSTMSKARAVGALKGVVIKQIDSDGALLEEWTLRNAFITNVDLGELSYDNEDLTNVTMTFRYDWATCVTAVGSQVDVGQAVGATAAATKFFDTSQ